MAARVDSIWAASRLALFGVHAEAGVHKTGTTATQPLWQKTVLGLFCKDALQVVSLRRRLTGLDFIRWLFDARMDLQKLMVACFAFGFGLHRYTLGLWWAHALHLPTSIRLCFREGFHMLRCWPGVILNSALA